MRVLFKKLNDYAKLPTYGSSAAAGMDLYANLYEEPTDSLIIHPGERKLIKTGLSFACSGEFYGRIAPRSGLAYKHGIDVLAGVVDADYRGDIGVVLINLGHGSFNSSYNEDFKVSHGDRIAQFIITPFVTADIEEVSELPESLRGEGGFGSTGQ